MTQLDGIPPALLERALALLSTDSEIGGHESLGPLMARLTATKEDLKGEVEAEIREGIESQYELEADGGLHLDPDDLATEKQITIGVGPMAQTVWIRWLVNKDFHRYAKRIPGLVRAVYKRGPSTLQEKSAIQMLQDAYTAAHAYGADKLKQLLYHELGQCLLDEHGQRVPWDFFEKYCLPSDVWEAIVEVYNENHRFFTGLWALVPGDIRQPLATSTGLLTKNIRQIAQMSLVLAQSLDGIGGTPSGGETPSMIRSLLSMAGSPIHSLISRWRNSGASENPSDDATIEKATSPGSTVNDSKTSPIHPDPTEGGDAPA